MKIIIDDTVAAEAFERIKQMMDVSAIRDSDLNGVAYTIERGDWTSVEHADELIAARVLSSIHAEINGTRDVPAGYRMTALGNMFSGRQQ